MYRVVTKTAFWIYFAILIITTVIPWSTSERVGTGLFEFRLDYLLHIGAYFGWASLYILMNQGFIDKNMTDIFIHVFAGLALAFSTEVVQWLIPYRSFNINDFLFNSIGIALSYACYFGFRKEIKMAIVRLK
jgi:VanZ family protein